jgi:ribosomal-protein-alanine N-acetyltransferase
VSIRLEQLVIAQMTQAEAEAVAGWHYEPPYDFYDATADEDDLALLLSAERREGRTFSVRGEGSELLGFFSFGPVEDGVVVVGLGLRPDLTGRGLGHAFVASGLAFARERFAPSRFRLSVAEFNERAIAVYERAGFVRTRSFDHATNGGTYPFVEMERSA